jgi:MFS family permease
VLDRLRRRAWYGNAVADAFPRHFLARSVGLRGGPHQRFEDAADRLGHAGRRALALPRLNALASLYVVSGVFGLFQGGIVPMYAVIRRELLPPREAGARTGVLVTATIVGMAFGGYFSGLIFDWTGSFRMAFFNGVLWNAVNVTIVD